MSAVARVYAEALFEAAREVDATAKVCDELRRFVAAYREQHALRDVLLDPRVETAGKHRVVEALLAKASPLLRNMVRLMLDKGRIASLPDVEAEYERKAAEVERLLDVTVTTAVELAPAQERAISKRVEQATGRSVRLSKRVDGELGGGLVLHIGDVVVDGSLRARARQLQERIHTAETRGGGT